MAKHLLIVESPAKAKTIQKYLGDTFTVVASYGHVRDLVPKEGAVDTENGFAMKYQVIEKNSRYIDAITKAASKVEDFYLATDPDREGEAISWHLSELLHERDLLKGKPIRRVVFHEVTQRAVQEAVANPRTISRDLVNAQQARRALDYLVGFNLSPLLWRKIRTGLSAGRVQSPALRMIVEREEQIENFKPREYWTIDADVAHDQQAFTARLIECDGQKIPAPPASIPDGDTAHQMETLLLAAAQVGMTPKKGAIGQLRVCRVEHKQRKRQPAAPFTTSTLQQEASRKLGFSTQRTMRVAQQLYEGIDTGEGAVGLITYMRTDSVHLSQEAVEDIRTLIAERYGAHNVPAKARAFKTRAKNAQEAHEAIRPTTVGTLPDTVRSRLADDQAALYDLIWKRTVACQMIHATLDTVSVDLTCGTGNTFHATGSTVADPGFMAVYREGVDEPSEEDDDQRTLPKLQVDDIVALSALKPEQHFTEPPAHYSEASLVKTLEEYEIGRPSTYSTIISTLLAREYVLLENRRFSPTDIGRIVNRFLTQHFNTYVDYQFTARLENDLDAISRGEIDWIPVMERFWGDFKRQVDEKTETVSRQDVVQVRALGIDPKTEKPVFVRMARFGTCAQIGELEGAEKPRFAALRPGQRLDTINLEEALALFQLPRALGTTPEGELMEANIGRFGPYIRYGGKNYVSLKNDDPYTIEGDKALELVIAHKKAQAEKLMRTFPASTIQILKGRFGPYVTDGNKKACLPKGSNPETITFEECQAILDDVPEKKKKRAATKSTTKSSTKSAEKSTTTTTRRRTKKASTA